MAACIPRQGPEFPSFKSGRRAGPVPPVFLQLEVSFLLYVELLRSGFCFWTVRPPAHPLGSLPPSAPPVRGDWAEHVSSFPLYKDFLAVFIFSR